MISHSLAPHLLATLFLLLVLPRTLADPAIAKFTDCFDFSGSSAQKLKISTVYAQVIDNSKLGTHLNLTVLGTSPSDIVGYTNTSGSLATLFTSTSVLTLNAWTNSSYFCSTLRPPSPLPTLESNATYCPVSAGPFAFSSTVPWGSRRALTTLTTRLRAVDPFDNELMCIEVVTTPLDPQRDLPYGRARIIFWCTVALAIAYWLVVGIARIVSAWGRGSTRDDGVWSKARSAGFVLASAISGEQLATSPALMRFCTPSMRDIFFHTQWCAVLSMVAVQWPPFVYPLLTQTAWSTLSYNRTRTTPSASHLWNPLSTPPFSPPLDFAGQLTDPASPLFVDLTLPNILYTLPDEAQNGISSFAFTVGIRPQDLFSTCLVLFLGILGATILLSILIWLVDRLAWFLNDSISGSGHGPSAVARLTGSRSPGFTNIKDSPDISSSTGQDNKLLNPQNTGGTGMFRPSSRLTLPLASGGSISERGIPHRAWGRIRSDIGSFHGTVLHGNLVRILVLFHLPVTIFSCYQMTLSREQASLSSRALAGLSFSVFSVLIPAHLVFRVKFTTTNKLYDETRTLLSLGPLYNHYRHGSQLFASLLFASNLAFGVTIGAGQHSGTAQAIIILVIEVVSALVTSMWLPWGSGASMGLISFLFCVARIVIAVLLVILTPTISVGTGAAGWVAYGILTILTLVFIALSLMLIVKIVEAIVRVVAGISFDRSRHVVDSGLLGACGLLGCCGPRKRNRKRRPRDNKVPYKPTELKSQNVYRDRDGMPYIPRIFPDTDGSLESPRYPGHESRKGSTNSGPPSVLRPEHAMQPYKEDDEDEGFIMGAWQRFPQSEYAPVYGSSSLSNTPDLSNPRQAPKPPQSTNFAQSGFSRVGGGKANFDTPYAITGGSTHTFPSVGQQSVPHPSFFDADDSPPPSLSTVGNYTQDFTLLPPGAMQPSHTRTKSQSAVIEDASILTTTQDSSSIPFSPPPETGGGGLHPPMVPADSPPDPNDTDSEDTSPKKKPWYHIRRNRAIGSEETPSRSPLAEPPILPVDVELGGLGETPQPTRSFVVIRKPQAGGRLNQPGPSGLRYPHATA